ncbi:MAG: molybdenum cofactor guanylyltransferase [Kosmotogaceae bacterium]
MKKQSEKKTIDLSVVVQAGGKSSRMGENKALMSLSGQPLIQRVIERVEPIAQELFVVTSNISYFSFLGVNTVDDTIPDKGALGGLYTAMNISNNDYVAVVACDLPFVNTNILLKGLDLLIQSGADVAIPKTGKDFYEPLHAVYRRDPCKDAIYQAIMQNQWRAISWLSHVKVIEMELALCLELDPSGIAFFNLNTKENFLEAEKIIQESLK